MGHFSMGHFSMPHLWGILVWGMGHFSKGHGAFSMGILDGPDIAIVFSVPNNPLAHVKTRIPHFCSVRRVCTAVSVVNMTKLMSTAQI